MYYSKHNNKIVYIIHYSGLLEVEGEGVLSREDAELSPKPTENLAEEYDTLSITEGITEIQEGYLEAFPYISCLILSRTVESVAVTPETIERMQKDKVLIRGEYDTFAERFARKNKLDFLHSDIALGEFDIEPIQEHDIVTLRFHEDANPDIHFNCFTPGSSAGSYGGGEYVNELPEDFYVGCTIEKFADNSNNQLREQILSNETLKRFLEISNERLKSETEVSEKKGKYWTAYYDKETGRYFAEIMSINREGCEDYRYEITKDIYRQLGTFEDDYDNEELINTGERIYSFQNTMYGTLGPEETVWDEDANERMLKVVENHNKKK